MDLPFTRPEFFDVFARYNDAVWPLQLAFIAAALWVVGVILARRPGASRWTLAVLALLWLWIGLVYHGIYFRPINPAAVGFAGLFVAEAVLLAWAWRSPGEIAAGLDWRGVFGGAFVVYGLVIYPLIGYTIGHRYPAMPTFGVPCPTTLFTVGVLLWARPIRPALMIIPVLWSLIACTAAFRLGVYEDSALAVAAFVGIAAIVAELARRRAVRVARSRIAGSAL